MRGGSLQRILFINTSPYVSGAEISMYSTLSLLNKDYTLGIISGNNNFFSSLNCTILKVNFANYFSLKSLYSLYNSLKFIKNFKADVIYCNTLKSFLQVLPLLFILRRSKVVCHLRDNIRYKFLKYILSFFCDQILCNSNFVKGQLRAIKKVKVIYNGLDINLFNKRIELRQRVKTVACISQITPWKNIEDYLKVIQLVAQNHRDIKFLIIGDYLNPKDKAYKMHLKELVKQLHIIDYVEFTGFIENIHDLYSTIDILCHTAIEEPFGRVIIEAMAHTIPVIAYNSGGPSEIIKNETGVLVPVGDTKVFAYALERLITNYSERKTLGRNARAYVKNHFEVENYKRQMIASFDNLLV